MPPIFPIMEIKSFMKIKCLAILLLLGILSSCTVLPTNEIGLKKFSAYSFDYFDTVTTVTGYAESQEAFDEIADGILKELGEYHRLFTIYHRFEGLENLCTINELVNGTHRVVTVDRRIIDMLLYAKDMYHETDGHVNIAMGSVLSIWHDYRSEGMSDPSAAKLPPMEKLTAAAAHTDIQNLVLDEVNCTVTITDPAMTLDVGAIAKGYAVEMVAQGMEARGISGYVLNVGGNIRTVGAKPDGNGWTVGVENPQEEGEAYTAYLALTDQTLVTSGSYQRYYLVNGKRYHHIIHPDTLMPAEGYLSISVLTAHSGTADALSTALFCMSLEEGQALVASLADTEVQWILSDGTRVTSDNWTTYEIDP